MPSNKLEEAAILARVKNLVKNTYDSENNSNSYTVTHTRALSDNETPVYGKGTGIFLDIFNGGGYDDINGVPKWAGSGRLAAYTNNLSTWGYGPGSTYTAPDTTLNSGQVNID
jgi:hypothetical protein